MKILALTKYTYSGASSRYRFYNYRECFEKSGINLIVEPFFLNSYLSSVSKIKKIYIVIFSYIKRFFLLLTILIFKNRYKIILIEYELFPYFPPIFEYLLKRRGIKYIVDYDDAIFHKYDSSKNIFIKLFFKNKIARVMSYASSVVVCNEYLEDYAKKYNHNTLRLPTVVLLDKYKEVMKDFKKDNSNFTIGWIGSKSTSKYILEILPVMQKFSNKHKDVEFNLVGFDETICLDKNINVIRWEEETEIKNILNFDVGIMPLDNSLWSRGKCAFKLVQYMSCKKPVIASPVGMNCTIVNNNINGFLVNSEDEWFKAFEALYENHRLREEMGNNNYMKIKSDFNHSKNCIKYINLIKNII